MPAGTHLNSMNNISFAQEGSIEFSPSRIQQISAINLNKSDNKGGVQ